MTEQPNEAKHTPGPWRYHDDGWITTGDGAASICRVADAKDHVEVSDTQRNADGKLLAAAPDLLAACEEFVRFAELPEIVTRGDHIRYQVKALDAARAAIAKAQETQ